MNLSVCSLPSYISDCCNVCQTFKCSPLFSCLKWHIRGVLLISPHGIAMPKGFYFTAVVFLLLFFSTPNLRMDLSQTWTHIHLWLPFETFGPNSHGRLPPPTGWSKKRFLGDLLRSLRCFLFFFVFSFIYFLCFRHRTMLAKALCTSPVPFVCSFIYYHSVSWMA